MIGAMDSGNRLIQIIKSQSRIWMIFLSMLIGTVFPAFGALSWMIQYLLVVMLFFSFSQIDLRQTKFPPQLAYVVIANMVLGIGAYFVVAPWDADLAKAAFITAIAPTAISSTVITGLLGRNIAFVSTAVLLTNITAAVVVPLLLPLLDIADATIPTAQILTPVLATLLIPLIASRFVGFLPVHARHSLMARNRYSFYLWLATLIIVVAKTVQFIESQQDLDGSKVISIAIISLVLCVVNFSVGYLIGGKAYAAESSQSLGQKNNSFVVWIALTFINPLAALGPTFYILYHNLYNSWQIIRHSSGQPLPKDEVIRQ